MGSRRFLTLGDLPRNGADAIVECLSCRRRRKFRGMELAQMLGPRTSLRLLQTRLRCVECQAKGARIVPVPRDVAEVTS